MRSALFDVLNENNYDKQSKKGFLKSITKQNDIKLPLKTDSVMINKKGQVYLKPKTDVIGNQRKNKLVTYNMQTGATVEVDPR